MKCSDNELIKKLYEFKVFLQLVRGIAIITLSTNWVKTLFYLSEGGEAFFLATEGGGVQTFYNIFLLL